MIIKNSKKISLPQIATATSTGVAFFLAITKLIVGIITGSVAVMASAVDSILDMFVSIFNMVAVKVSESRANETFNYGKGKIEGLAALFEGLLIIGSAGFIFWSAIQKLIHHEQIQEINLAFYVMILSLIITFGLVYF